MQRGVGCARIRLDDPGGAVIHLQEEFRFALHGEREVTPQSLQTRNQPSVVRPTGSLVRCRRHGKTSYEGRVGCQAPLSQPARAKMPKSLRIKMAWQTPA